MATDVSQLKEAIADWVNRGGDEAALLLQNDVDTVVPVGSGDDPHPGMLRDSKETLEVSRVDAGGGEWRDQLAYTAEYASYTDTGSDPHQIDGNPLLAFNWPKVGKFMILHSVQHPGTAGTRWWSDHVTEDNWGVMVGEALDSVGFG